MSRNTNNGTGLAWGHLLLEQQAALRGLLRVPAAAQPSSGSSPVPDLQVPALAVAASLLPRQLLPRQQAVIWSAADGQQHPLSVQKLQVRTAGWSNVCKGYLQRFATLPKHAPSGKLDTATGRGSAQVSWAPDARLCGKQAPAGQLAHHAERLTSLLMAPPGLLHGHWPPPADWLQPANAHWRLAAAPDHCHLVPTAFLATAGNHLKIYREYPLTSPLMYPSAVAT